jgi:hypothetical protein
MKVCLAVLKLLHTNRRRDNGESTVFLSERARNAHCIEPVSGVGFLCILSPNSNTREGVGYSGRIL